MSSHQLALGLFLTLSVLAFRTASAQEETDLTTRIEQLERENASLRRQVEALKKIALSDSKQHWVDRLLGLQNHNQTAFVVGPKLILIDPDTALAAVQEAWPRIEKQKVKTGILKAFAFGKPLRPKKHSQGLKVLHLGMTDADPEVRKYAAVYLKEYAKDDFADRPDDYAEWYRKYGDQSPEELIRPDNAQIADVADVPTEDRLVGSNKQMRYFRIGPRKDAKAPEDGYKLIVILPGGDGSEQFHPFVRRLYQNAFGDDYLAVQPVAFKWNEQQRIVWPTKSNPVEGQEFSTEEFVESVIKDVSKTYPIDKDFVFTLSWSSSGPAAYALSLEEEASVTGSYIAMSVFKPDTLPPLKHAGGHVYFLDHSPQDRICPFRMAKAAEEQLQKNGAAVLLKTYEGGHGWHGDVYGRVRKGIEWLEKQREGRE
jgi:predicted esterase